VNRRSFRHWTPRYIFNRANEILYQRSEPDHPWLTRNANELLNTLLIRSDRGLEFGCGRSTIWLARRVGVLISVEHNRRWYEKVMRLIQQEGLNGKVQLLLNECQAETDARGPESDYVKVLTDFEDSSLDFILVDGVYRSDCAVLGLPKLKPGGLLILDNANWFLPNQDTASPNSRRKGEGPAHPRWVEFLGLVDRWRFIWTSSGVTDTAIYFKPPIYPLLQY
jgi:predicted O-methyltransferase YrrM